MRGFRLLLALGIGVLAVALLLRVPGSTNPGVSVPPPPRVVHRIDGPDPLRVLWLGNSHTFLWDVPGLVAQMYRSQAERGLEIHAVTKGGASLPAILAVPEAVQAIEDGDWSVLILQEGSYVANLRHDLQAEYLQTVLRRIDEPSARVILYQNWAYAGRLVPDRLRSYADATDDPEGFMRLYEGYYADPPLTRQAALDARFTDLARQIGAEVAFAGQAIWAGQSAELALISHDGNHLEPDGAIVAAATIYRTLFGVPPLPTDDLVPNAGWSVLMGLANTPQRPRGPGWSTPPDQ